MRANQIELKLAANFLVRWCFSVDACHSLQLLLVDAHIGEDAKACCDTVDGWKHATRQKPYASRTHSDAHRQSRRPDCAPSKSSLPRRGRAQYRQFRTNAHRKLTCSRHSPRSHATRSAGLSVSPSSVSSLATRLLGCPECSAHLVVSARGTVLFCALGDVSRQSVFILQIPMFAGKKKDCRTLVSA